MAKSPNNLDFAEWIEEAFEGRLKYNSGKWFCKNREIKLDNDEFFYDIEKIRRETKPEEPTTIQRLVHTYLNLAKDKRNDIKGHLQNICRYEGQWIQLEVITKVLENPNQPYTKSNLNHFQKLIIKNLLFEPESELMFIVYGIGGSGKSTYLNLIKQLFDNDVSSIQANGLATDYNRYQALKHRLICSDELGSDTIDNQYLKQIVSKQQVSVRSLYCNPEEIVSQSRIIYSCNKPPSLNVSDTGILRRIKYYKMDKKILNPDTSMNKKKFDKKELINIALECYHEQGSLEELNDDTHEAIMQGNSVFKMMKYNRDRNDYYSDNYETYKAYCYDNGYKPFNRDNFENIYELIKEWRMFK